MARYFGPIEVDCVTPALPNHVFSVGENGATLTPGPILSKHIAAGQINPAHLAGTAIALSSYLDGVLAGNFADGNATCDGATAVAGMSLAGSVYTLTRSVNYGQLTINNGITVVTGGYVLRARYLMPMGTASINNNGFAGTAAVNTTIGQGGLYCPGHMLGGGTGRSSGKTTTGNGGPSGAVGAAGGAGLAGAGFVSGSTTPSICGGEGAAGVAGGAGNSEAGGGGGAYGVNPASSYDLTNPFDLSLLDLTSFCAGDGNGNGPLIGSPYPALGGTQGGGGGGGGGASSLLAGGAGGGGGGGGGNCLCVFGTIDLRAWSGIVLISANGGPGGAGAAGGVLGGSVSGAGGSGGGGGGGVVKLVTRAVVNGALVAGTNLTAAGGAGGAFGGAAGQVVFCNFSATPPTYPVVGAPPPPPFGGLPPGSIPNPSVGNPLLKFLQTLRYGPGR